MKHETSNLLIGLGIGAVVGVAVGYLMVADNRKKLAEEFDHAVSKVKEEVTEVYGINRKKHCVWVRMLPSQHRDG